jgi:Cyclin-dependent kinase 2-associated protein
MVFTITKPLAIKWKVSNVKKRSIDIVEMDLMDLQAVDHIKSKLQDVTVTPIPMRRSSPYDQSYTQSNVTSQSQISPLILTSYQSNNTSNLPSPLSTPTNPLFSLNTSSSLSKYAQLLLVIEEMGRDLRPTYTGSRRWVIKTLYRSYHWTFDLMLPFQLGWTLKTWNSECQILGSRMLDGNRAKCTSINDFRREK